MGFVWSPVAYPALLRTSKTVSRQHAQEKQKEKKIEMYLVMVIKVPFFHLQELTFFRKRRNKYQEIRKH